MNEFINRVRQDYNTNNILMIIGIIVTFFFYNTIYTYLYAIASISLVLVVYTLVSIMLKAVSQSTRNDVSFMKDRNIYTLTKDDFTENGAEEIYNTLKNNILSPFNKYLGYAYSFSVYGSLTAAVMLKSPVAMVFFGLLAIISISAKVKNYKKFNEADAFLENNSTSE